MQTVLVGDEDEEQDAEDSEDSAENDVISIWTVNQLNGQPVICSTGFSYLKIVQKVMVRMTKAQFHSWSSWMVATPRNMKMIVSDELVVYEWINK